MSTRQGRNIKKNLMALLSVLIILIMFVFVDNTLAQTPDFVWAKQAGGSSNDNARSIATDGSGNSFITGDFQGSANFGTITLTSVGGSDIFVAEYDSSGNMLWAKRAGGTSSDVGWYIETDGSGNAIVTGHFSGSASFGSITLTSAGSSDIFIAKYDDSGNVLWAKRAGGTGSDCGYGIDADWAGNSIVTGYFAGTATFDSYILTSAGSWDIFVAKYDASGNVLWAKRAGGTGYDYGHGIIIAESGNSIITGRFDGSATFGSTTLTSAGGSDIFIAKYDAAGVVLWAKQAGGTGNDYGYSVTRDGSYNGIITGSFQGSATFGAITLTSAGSSDIFITKYDDSGNVLWARRAGGTNSDNGYNIAIDRSGNSVVTGYFDGSATFGTTTLTSAGSGDIFIVKYDDSGNMLWANRAGGTDPDVGSGIATDGSDNIIVTGTFNGSATFGATTLTSAGQSDIFITKLMETAAWIMVTYPNGGEVLYVGNNYTITWTTNNYAGLVEIALSKDGGSNWINLTDPYYAPNTGSYDYIPQPEHVSNNCLIQITSIENATVKDRSDHVFSIVDTHVPGQYVAMRIPVGIPIPTIDGVFNEPLWSLVPEDSLLFGGIPEAWGVVWTNWNDNLVTWKAVWSDISNELYVAIKIKDDIRGIFDNNDPFVPWKDECLEIFTDGDNSGGFYENTYDNAQQWLVTGENKIVLDDYPDSIGYHLYTGDDLVTAVTWSINGDWSCEAKFKIYDTLPTSRKILSIGDIIGWNIWYDDSDNETWEIDSYTRDHQVGWLYEGKANNNADYFGDLLLAGDLPHIRVISPNGGEIWYVDTTYTITWTSAGTSGEVKLAYSTDGGFNWTTIVTSTVDDGFYSWTVPDDPSDNCLILVTDTDGSPMDQSDSCFTIASTGFNINGRIDYYFNNEPVKDAFVKTNTVYSDTTDPNGEYELLNLPSDNYTVRPEKINDIANAISAFDAANILQYGVGLQTFTPYQMLASDVTGNGSVSAYDASMILQYGVGLINQFPVMEDTTHFWRFVPEDFSITPSNWTTAPDSIAYTPLNSDTTGNYYGIIYGDVSGNWHPSGSALASLGKSSAGTVDIRLEDICGGAGDKVILPLVLENGTDIVSLSFNLEYDAKVLKALNASTTEITENWQIAYNIKGDLIKVAVAGNEPISNSGAIVYLEFDVLGSKSSDASSPFNILDVVINEGNVSVNIHSANFTRGTPTPKEYALSQNHPNPFNSLTMIKYQLPKSAKVVLKIYNTLGQEIRTLVDEDKKAGYYNANWDGRNDDGMPVSSGVYIYRMQAGDFVKVKKLLFLM